MSSERARSVRQAGHDDATEFAKQIGLSSDYNNDKQAKKDVIDPFGDAHSVKSGKKRWQIFLYHRSRFERDSAFQTMNGIGQIFIQCLQLFPDNFSEYKSNKNLFKQKLRIYMIELKNRLSEKRRLKSFLEKSFFNGNEVKYLTIKVENQFHVFHAQDVVESISANCIVENSKARREGEISEQKVLIKFENTNLGEIEIRNSSPNHYREVLFVVNRKKAEELLFSKIKTAKIYAENVILHGLAIKKFGRGKNKIL